MSSLNKGIDYAFIREHVSHIIEAVKPLPIHVPLHCQLGRVRHNIVTMINKL